MNKKSYAIVICIGIILLFSVKLNYTLPDDVFPTPEKSERTRKWGFVFDKKTIIKYKYDDADEFSSGLARVELNGVWGYIDKTGKEVIPLGYDFAYNFNEDLAKIGLNGKYGFINQTGIEVVQPKYSHVGDFIEGLAWVELNGKYGYIDKTGKEVIPLNYDAAGNFSYSPAKVKFNDKYGYIGKDGEVVIPLIYDEADDFVNGYAQVRLAEKTGIIDVNETFTVQSMKILLLEAIKNKYVLFSAHGSGIESSHIKIENVTDMQLHLIIPEGTFLRAHSSNYQSMVLTGPKDVVLDAGKTYEGNVNTACMNISRSVPDGDVTFGLSQRPENHLLTKLIRLLNEGDYTYSVKQAAVWIVTDGADYDDMGILHNQFYQRIIDLEDYQKAVSIVNEARNLK